MGKIIWINFSRSLEVEFFMIMSVLVSPLLESIEDSEISPMSIIKDVERKKRSNPTIILKDFLNKKLVIC